MASFNKDFMFGEFDDLSPEEHQRIFNILHGNKKESGSKIEFPWDDEEEPAGAVGGTGYEVKSWADEVVDISYQERYRGNADNGAHISFMSDTPQVDNYNNNTYGSVVDGMTPVSGTPQKVTGQNKQFNTPDGRHAMSESGAVVNRDQFDRDESMAECDVNYGSDSKYVDRSGSSSKLQASLKPYERRNKKKRPPDYYKQPEEASSGAQRPDFHLVQPDLTQPPPNFHPEMRFSVPPPGLNPRHFMVNRGVRYSHPGDHNYPNPAQLPNFPTGVPVPFQGANPQFVTPVVLQRNSENVVSNQAQETGDLCEVVIDRVPPANSVNIPARPETYQIQDHERTNPDLNFGDKRLGQYNADHNYSHSNENFATQNITPNMQRETVVKPTRVNVSVKDALREEYSSHIQSEDMQESVQNENMPAESESVKSNVETGEDKTEISDMQSEVIASEDLPEEKDSVQITSDSVINTDAHAGFEEQKSESQPEADKKTEEMKANKPTTWAGLFKSNSTTPSIVVRDTPVVNSMVDNSKQNHEAEQRSEKELSPQPVPASEDSAAKDLGDHLSKMTISHASVSLQPRGLVNRANWCYIHGTLQALVACPPFYNLLKKLPRYPAVSRGPSSTPILDALVEFMHEFQPMSRNFERGQKGVKDITPGVPFEPAYVYKMLQAIAVNPHFKLGKQEDAEEFLSCVLDGLHEEMSAAVNLSSNLVNNQEPLETEDGYVNGFVHAEGEEPDEELEEDSWEQVGPKKKSVQTRRANFAKTPVTEIFAGMVRSAVYKSTAKETATLEPFFTLQLDIQSEKVLTVKDALEGFVSKEQISGYNCPKTKTEVEVTKKLSLEELPPVLILHLKCFVYDKDGGSQKLMKKVDYNVDLEITKDLLSPSAKSRLTLQQRSYKLFAVVYHHGKKATGGHYTAIVFHPGINGWVNIDDSQVKTVPLSTVLKYVPPRVPYLLYYRRLDSH